MNSSKRINKTCAIIPIFNEENFIADVISKTIKHVDKIYIVNDGSTDNSIEKISNFPDVEILNLDKNYGKGKALKTGFQNIINSDFNFVITLDGDLQHDPERIPYFIKELENSDFVIGNRLKNMKSMPIQRIASNKITSFLLSVKSGKRILDSQSGYRGFRVNILEDIMPIRDGYEAESEMILRAAKKNYKFGFVDIPTIYGTEKSKMSPFKTTLNFIRLVLSRT